MHHQVLFRLDYDGGDIFVDPALLRPFPDAKIAAIKDKTLPTPEELADLQAGT